MVVNSIRLTPLFRRLSLLRPHLQSSRVTQHQSEAGPTAMEMKTQNQVENGEKDSVVANKKSPSHRALMLGQIFLCELIATFLLMLGVCLGCMDGLSSVPLSPIQSPLTSGFTVATLVAVFAHISDCHMNPAVSATFLSLGRIDLIQFAVYIAAEVIGAVTGVGVLRAILPESLRAKNPGHCETVLHKGMTVIGATFLEFFITSVLVFLVCAVTDKRNSTKQDSVAIKFGLAIAALSFAGGSLTGASMNPARTFGPALWANSWTNHWVYWVGPMAAGFVVPQLYMFLFEKELRNPEQ